MYSSYRLGKEGVLAPIDYGVVDKSLIGYGDIHEFGLANYTYSYVIGYDAKKFGKNPPKSWADFWDVKKYPGKRTLYKWMSANLECALLADGVPADQLYPLDVDRALRKIEELMPHVAHPRRAGEAGHRRCHRLDLRQRHRRPFGVVRAEEQSRWRRQRDEVHRLRPAPGSAGAADGGLQHGPGRLQGE
jgi:spermidine/putrescine-binding protein